MVRNTAHAIKTMLYRAFRRRAIVPVRAHRQRFFGAIDDAPNRCWRQTLFVTNELYFSTPGGVFFAPARHARAPRHPNWSYQKLLVMATHHGKACTTIYRVVCTVLDRRTQREQLMTT